MILFATLFGLAIAQTPRQILQKAFDSQQIDNSIQTVEMIQTRNNAQLLRQFELKLRKESNALYAHTRFTKPVEIAGMQLVRIDTPSKADPAMIYLPALNAVQKTTVSQLNKPFMGSDFSIADFEMNISDSDQLDLIEETASSWKIQSIPGNNDLYQKLVALIDKKSMLPLEVEYFDDTGHLKTLEIDDVQQREGQFVPMQSTMTNHRNGSTTRLRIIDIEINVSKDRIPLELFTEEGMKRER